MAAAFQNRARALPRRCPISLGIGLTLALICGCGGSGGGSSGGNPSPTSPAATPMLTPASGTSGTASLSVTIADSTPSASIFYTIDGSTPSASSTAYAAPITITANTTIKAIATASGYQPSAVASATYTPADRRNGT